MSQKFEKKKKLKVLVCGFGSVGSRYARILRKGFDLDIVLFRRKHRGNSFGIPELYRWEDIRRYAPDIAFITNPTYQHISTALAAVSTGAHIFLEKPISHSLAGIRQLEQECKRRRKVCYVAYTLRFVPIVQKAKQILVGRKILHGRAVCSSSLLDWRPGRQVKDCYSSYRGQGGGVILEVSHEFDLMEYLIGKADQISGWHGRLADITVDAEDTADAIMWFANGVCANIHLNFMSRKPERFFHIDFEGGFLRGDLLKHTLVFHNKGIEKVYHMPCEKDDYFGKQVKFFLKHLDDPGMMNNLSQAKGLFEKIINFRRKKYGSIADHRRSGRI
ncbi:MAG: Gfo/Idh/MocA family oxidoreductase [Candidatus Omnitrophica bacterium]|nr:Gfo/Idh/MocA family oxidoreductase [Candidatus Omnitrophota bacterium]